MRLFPKKKSGLIFMLIRYRSGMEPIHCDSRCVAKQSGYVWFNIIIGNAFPRNNMLGYIVFQLILMAASPLSSVLLVSCAKLSKVIACNHCVISGLRHSVNEIFALLGCYAACISSHRSFWTTDKLSRWDRSVTNWRISHATAVSVHFLRAWRELQS
jgi:hypothetical protein